MSTVSALADKVIADSQALGFDYDASRRQGDLWPKELFWREHQSWLEHRGYLLRPRYHPGWTPSWRLPGAKKDWQQSEDGQYPKVCSAGDVERASVDVAHVSRLCISSMLSGHQMDVP
jgi:hypothetical protein